MTPEDLQQQYGQALEYHEQGELNEAVLLYQSLLEQVPGADLVQYNLGLAFYGLGRFPEAADAFLAAAETNPDDPDYWFNAGLALKQVGKYHEALAAYEKAHLLRPDDEDLLYNTGCCHQAAGDRIQAMAAYEKVLALAGEHASALSNLAYCTHVQGEYEQAASLYHRVLVLRPDHAGARYMVDALEGKNTAAPPPEYVQQLFDGYSDSFDQDLVENLSYRVPGLLLGILEETIGRGKCDKKVIDLGCGTGLSGKAVCGYASSLSGVDLSENMVLEAEKKGCYDQLAVADVVAFLQQVPELVDLLVAADVLTYLGDLESLFQAAGDSTRIGGHFCFSTERGEEQGWQLRVTGRYGHHPRYIRELAVRTGWRVLQGREADIRKERGQWIGGALYLLEKV